MTFTPIVAEFIRWHGARMYLFDTSRGADAVTIIRDLVRLERAKAEAFMELVAHDDFFKDLPLHDDAWFDDTELMLTAFSLRRWG